MTEEFRRTEILRDGAWVEGRLSDVKKGDSFRMFEPDGSKVTHEGQDVFTALEDADFNEEGKERVYAVKISEAD